MGFLSSSSGLIRYKVVGETDSELWEKVPELLKEHRFKDIDDTSEELSLGWVCFDNMLDTRWESASPYKGEYICFSLRIDKRKISPAVFKKYYQMAIEEILDTKDRDVKYISKTKKQEIRENIRIKLLTKTLPVPSITDIVWNYPTNILYLSTTNKSTIEIFLELFQRTFSLQLIPFTPYELGKEIASNLKIDLDKYTTYLFSE